MSSAESSDQGVMRDLDDFAGMDAVRCLHCNRLQAWPAEGAAGLPGWSMTKHLVPTWLCPDAPRADYADVVAEDGYWSPSQVGPNAEMPGESWQTDEARAAAAKKEESRRAFMGSVEEERRLVAFFKEHVASGGDPGFVPAQIRAQVGLVDDAPTATGSIILSSGEAGCSWDWSQWGEKDIEDVILGWVYRTRHAPGPKVAADIQFSLLTGAGVPASEALLVPTSQRKSGVQRVMETTLRAYKWAASLILRDDDMLSNRTTGDGTAGASLQKLLEDGKDWREAEKTIHGELEYRFKKVFLKWQGLGWLVPEPVLKFSPGDSSGLGRDGLPDNCKLTSAAIDASDRIRSTPLASGYGSRLETSTEHQRQVARDQAPWFHKEWQSGSKAGT